ncbi:hypothetical protein AUR64_11260 [Haloprofundus marisrubri]|uniref:DUF3784 domain-containing protein n=1 Tax=Haloprofundus marisrubri TaxID=1514971 RepID=A0A0W1RC18_9EURY|nr:hypothetical protein [Haloprofundus marisrubri]KTG10163.1 hypothetical protein AUR64_11260 [Haloprofundus marisrubri]
MAGDWVTGTTLLVAGILVVWVGYHIVFGDGADYFRDVRSRRTTEGNRVARLAGGFAFFVGVVTLVYGVIAATSGLNTVLWVGYAATVLVGSVAVAVLAGIGGQY